MDGILALFANRVLLTALMGWFGAQGIKFAFALLSKRKIDFRYIYSSGGMPSSHSSLVCALATAVGISRGFQSVEFAMSFVLASVVMYDAAGVRRAAGRQAAVINRIISDMVKDGNGLTYERLKELIGHTPFEVVIGALLGILIAVLMV